VCTKSIADISQAEGAEGGEDDLVTSTRPISNYTEACTNHGCNRQPIFSADEFEDSNPNIESKGCGDPCQAQRTHGYAGDLCTTRHSRIHLDSLDAAETSGGHAQKSHVLFRYNMRFEIAGSV
jgi:hypothetical protein